MSNRILLKRSNVAGQVPDLTDLASGELGINLPDKILYGSDGNQVFKLNKEAVTPHFLLRNNLLNYPISIGSYLDNTSGFQMQESHGALRTNTAYRLNIFYLYPFCVFTDASIDRLALWVHSVQTTQLKFAIYRHREATTELMYELPSPLNTSTTGAKLFTVNFNLRKSEIYYVAVVSGIALDTGLPIIRSFHSNLVLGRNSWSVEGQGDTNRIVSRLKVDGLNYASAFPVIINNSNFRMDSDDFGLTVPFVGFRIGALL